MGPRDQDGYGRVSLRSNKRVLAHRLAWFIDRGDIPSDLCVLHLCDNPPCCNVNHLMIGTREENARQAGERDLVQYGSARYNAKLDEEKVAEMKVRYRAGGVSQYQLAREYGVSQGAIQVALTGKRWRRVP